MRRNVRCTLSAVLAVAISAGIGWSLESASGVRPVSQPAQQPAVTPTDAALVGQLSLLQRQLDSSAGGSLAVRREILRLRAVLAARRASVPAAVPGGGPAQPAASGPANSAPGRSAAPRPRVSSSPVARSTSAPTPTAAPTPTSTATDDGGGDD